MTLRERVAAAIAEAAILRGQLIEAQADRAELLDICRAVVDWAQFTCCNGDDKRCRDCGGLRERARAILGRPVQA